jgi:uridylate kinase
MHVVLSIGGSAVVPGGKPNIALLKAMTGMMCQSKHNFGVVVGGGPPSRAYAEATRKLGGSEFDADEIAIMSTMQNAKLMAAALGGCAPSEPIKDFRMAREYARRYKAVVMGGTIPGITTDTDCVLLAEAIGAKRLVNVSNVAGIYDSDPGKNKKAKKFDFMSYEELISLAMASDKRMAGTNFVFDLLACKLIARSKIEAHFVGWKSMTDVRNAIEGKRHGGTVVK